MNGAELLRGAMGGRTLWFLDGSALQAMAASLAIRVEANLPAAEPPKAARLRTSSAGSPGLVAMIPIHGVIEQRGGLFSYFFGGTSVDALTDQLRQALNDPAVSAIVLDVDSPGGTVSGVDELATEIYQARKAGKPITAVSNGMMASAAYYLASQASEILVSPSSLTGSIGVYTTHEDDSVALANYGVKMTLIQYGANKTEGNNFEPLSDDAKAHMQEMVDAYGQAFEKAVARGRGVKQDDVHGKFGQGRVFTAAKAVKLGLADRVGTLDDALAKHGAARPAGSRASSFASVLRAGEEKKTKRVDGEDLTIDCFAYRGDPEKTAEWKLPIQFSDEEKTKSHIRNAIARFDQTDMPDADEKKRAWSRIKAAAKKYGIEISEDDEKAAWPGGAPQAGPKADPEDGDGPEDGDDTDCACACAECEAGDCQACSHANCTCNGCQCSWATNARKKAHAANRRRLELAAI